LISVRVNDDLVFQGRLQPQADQIEGSAYQAAVLAARHLETRGAPPVY
jgi:hypothetical protein